MNFHKIHVELQIEREDSQNETSNLLPRMPLNLKRTIHRKKAQLFNDMVTSPGQQINDSMQEHKVQVHRKNKINHQIREFLLLHHVKLVTQLN